MTIYGDVWRKVHGTVTGRPDNFSWLIENKLAGSAIPTSNDEVQWVIEQGVKSIVTVREEPLDNDWVKDVNYLHMHSNDMEIETFGYVLAHTFETKCSFLFVASSKTFLNEIEASVNKTLS